MKDTILFLVSFGLSFLPAVYFQQKTGKFYIGAIAWASGALTAIALSVLFYK